MKYFAHIKSIKAFHISVGHGGFNLKSVLMCKVARALTAVHLCDKVTQTIIIRAIAGQRTERSSPESCFAIKTIKCFSEQKIKKEEKSQDCEI